MQKTYEELVKILLILEDNQTNLELIELGLESKCSVDVSSAVRIERVLLNSIENQLTTLIEYIDNNYLSSKTQKKNID